MKPGLIDRHIGTTILLAIVAVTAAVVFLTFVFSLIDEAQLGSGDGSIGEAVVIALWTLPPKLVEVMPFTIFMGALIGLGVLSSHSEITVYRSAGVSTLRISVSCAIPSLVVVGVLMGVSMVFTSIEGTVGSKDRAKSVETEWVKSGDNYIEIGSLNIDGEAKDVVTYQFDDQQRLDKISMAESGQYDIEASEWTMHNVRITNLGNTASSVESKEKSRSLLSRTPESLLTAITKKPNKMTLVELANHIDYLRSESLDARRYQIEYWRTLLLPLSILGLVLIATSFVMGQTREMGMGTRLIIGVGVGFAFHYVQAFVTPLSIVYDFHPVLAIAVPIVLVWILGVWLTIQAR